MADDEEIRVAADALGADYDTARGRIEALCVAADAMVGPASKPREEVQVLLCGALVRACRASFDPVKALDNAVESLQGARRNTERKSADAYHGVVQEEG